MTIAVQSAIQAYQAASELAPPFVDAAEVDDTAAWRRAARKLNEPMDVRSDHLIAAGGAIVFLIAGAACGAWMAG